MKARKINLLFLAVLLIFVSLACAQAGTIRTEAEATEFYKPTATVFVENVLERLFDEGDSAQVEGGEFSKS